MSRNAISEESVCMLRGPIQDKRVIDCQRGITKSEFSKYVVDEAQELGVLIEDKNAIAIDAYYFEYSYLDSQDQIDRYKIIYNFRLERSSSNRGENLMTYKRLKTDPIITFDELQSLTKNVEFWDTHSVLRIYELRPCSDNGPRYAKEKSLSSFDKDYADLYEAYVKLPNWYTQLKLFMYLLINGLALQRSEINEAISPLNEIYLQTFSTPAPMDGEPTDLANMMEKIEAFGALVRNRIQKSK